MSRHRFYYFVTAFNLLTVVLWLWFLYAIFGKQPDAVPLWIIEIYLLALSYYVGDKEIRRWRRNHAPFNRHGEIFVIGWIAIFLTAAVFDLAMAGRGYHLPEFLILTTAYSTLVYIVTRYLKQEYRRRK